MIHLERLIIGASIGEKKFNQVEFLEAKDFQHYSNYWQLVLACNGDLWEMLKHYPLKSQEYIVANSMIVYSNDLYFHSIKLVEMRFERLLDLLLYNLSRTTENALESSILIEAKELIKTADIFDLGDNLIEYIGHHITPKTKLRIDDYLKWRDNRVNEIKKYEPTGISK